MFNRECEADLVMNAAACRIICGLAGSNLTPYGQGADLHRTFIEAMEFLTKSFPLLESTVTVGPDQSRKRKRPSAHGPASTRPRRDSISLDESVGVPEEAKEFRRKVERGVVKHEKPLIDEASGQIKDPPQSAKIRCVRIQKKEYILADVPGAAREAASGKGGSCTYLSVLQAVVGANPYSKETQECVQKTLKPEVVAWLRKHQRDICLYGVDAELPTDSPTEVSRPIVG